MFHLSRLMARGRLKTSDVAPYTRLSRNTIRVTAPQIGWSAMGAVRGHFQVAVAGLFDLLDSAASTQRASRRASTYS